MDLAQLVKDYGHRKGLGALDLDDEGRAYLLLDGSRTLTIDHRPESGAVFLRMTFELSALGLVEQTELYRRMLEANLLGEATGGAVFSLDLADERIELHRRLPLDDRLDPSVFNTCVEALYGAAVDLAGRLTLSFSPTEGQTT